MTGVSTVFAIVALGVIWYGTMPTGLDVNAPIIRIASMPELRTIGELRKASRIEPMKQCNLPEVSTGSSGILATSTDGTFKLYLSGNWRRLYSDTSTAKLVSPHVVYRDQAVGSIRIDRVANGNESRSFRADNKAEPLRATLECEVSNDSSGSIWTFYDLGGKDGYTAMADAVTPQGKRHKFSIYSTRASSRDSLVSVVANAVLRQQP